MVAENAGLSDQHKTAHDKLVNKTKELKDAQNDRKKATENEKVLQEALNSKNRKIAELEIALATTKSILTHSKEINSKDTRENKSKHEEAGDSEKKTEPKPSSPTKAMKRCRFENTGTCIKNSSCTFVHPKLTCQSFSKVGSCQRESKCDYRHPRSVCESWRRSSSCHEGESCRNRHPVDCSRPPPMYIDPRLQSNRAMTQNYNQTQFKTQTPVMSSSFSSRCGSNPINNQSFLEMGVAAACGPGRNSTNSPTATTMRCCPEQTYSHYIPGQPPHHSHPSPRQ